MRVESTGNVGIGVAPASNIGGLIVQRSSSWANIIVNSTDASSYSSIRLNNGNTAPAVSGGALHHMGSSYTASAEYAPDGTSLTGFGTGGVIINANNAAGIIKFTTSATERMRITAAGVIQDGAGNELGYRDIKPNTNTFVRGQCNVVTTNQTLGASTAGATYTLFNNSAGSITLTASGVYIRLGGTTSTGTRTVLPYGLVTLWYLDATTVIVNGNVT
jgi:hypothetical protein